MSDFASVTFERIKEQYADVDVGAGALYAVIVQQIDDDNPEVARDLSLEAARIHSNSDSFIVEGETTATDVFLEVFRRTLFVPLPAGMDDEQGRALWRGQITSTATLLSNFRVYTIRKTL